jgi:SAM-dependent methyltransferase
MPTIPPTADPEPELKPHQHRQLAESFGTDAGRYDRARPSYPDALVTKIVDTLPGLDLLDVGCGTGIAARQFQAAGCRVLGIDVDERMADQARHGGLDTEVAKFETWDPAGRQFDAVIAGQAWHWVDPVAGAVKAAQALRPAGRIAVFWNVAQAPPHMRDTFAAVQHEVLSDESADFWRRPALDLYAPGFARAADGIEQSGSFGPAQQWRFDWERLYTRDEWLDQVPTFGGMNQLPPAKLAELLTKIGAAIDAAGGSFTMGYATVAVTAVRSGR